MGLRAAYDRAASLIGPDRAESFEVALEVELLRPAQRPATAKLDLLREMNIAGIWHRRP